MATSISFPEKNDLEAMVREVRTWTHEKQWRGPDAPPRSMGEEVALIHTEIAEGTEAYRLHGLERWVVHPNHATQILPDNCGYGDFKPEGLASEMADVLIRLLDCYGEYSIPLDEEYMDHFKIVQRAGAYADIGTAMSKLHTRAARVSEFDEYAAYGSTSSEGYIEQLKYLFDFLLAELLFVCLQYNIQLLEEYEHKMKYNWTRANRHGGKKL